MDVTTPDLPGLTSAFLLGDRRRPGSAVGPGNIEKIFAVILKRSYTIEASDSDAAAGRLVPELVTREIHETDLPGEISKNGDFADGLTSWFPTGGASASADSDAAIVTRDGAVGDLRQSTGFGRTLRDRQVSFSVEASAAQGEMLPPVSLSASGETALAEDPGGVFPTAAQQPVTMSSTASFTGAATSSILSVRLGTLATNNATVTYAAASATTIEFESDLVPFKPEADLIVLADSDPVPVTLAIDGDDRMSQAALPERPITGLGWEARSGTPREADGGSFDPAPSQALPDAFNNRYYNGYRRDRRIGASVPYPSDGSEIVVTDDDGDIYAFTLTTGTPQATHTWFTGEGDDDPCLWRRREVSFVLDTLVIDRDRDEAYAVWRATWPVDIDPDGLGRPIPLENNRGVTVRWEGG